MYAKKGVVLLAENEKNRLKIAFLKLKLRVSA